MATKATDSSSLTTIAHSKPALPKPLSAHQTAVYSLLLQIPRGRVASYASMAKALNSSPRAVGGALRTNPWAPEVPCHRVIAASGFIGGFQGDWQAVPSGCNVEKKLKLLTEEGVTFDGKSMLNNRKCWWDGFEV